LTLIKNIKIITMKAKYDKFSVGIGRIRNYYTFDLIFEYGLKGKFYFSFFSFRDLCVTRLAFRTKDCRQSKDVILVTSAL